jgi:hypothetical protein
MNQTETIVIIEFSNGKIYFQIVFHALILIYFIQETFCECSDDAFFVVAYHILKELIDKFHFEISKIKTSVVVAIVLICKIQYDFILLRFILRIQEFVNKSICEVLNLSMAGHE